MSGMHDVAVIVGSLRKGSFNRKMANALIAMEPTRLRLEIVEIGNLPFFDQDLEGNPPQPWVDFRARILRAHAVLFLTPEYNRSVTAVLKNALDVGSRPYGSNAWAGKPGAVVSVTPGALGGFGANQHLRQSLVAVNVIAMAQPEAYIASADRLFDGDGRLTDERTRECMRVFLHAFAAWVDLNVRVVAAPAPEVVAKAS
jgi:chromate reductase, NAD(P)H dehydrogenase (quinone)